ncbi:MAG: shikimate dehydrogenase [Proteobacteria bacterium]|nr:shikimate dehydrogenase [Pseudomonadota bacterium]
MTYQLALFGHPVNHSLSPEIHRDFARQFNLDINYQLIDVNTDKLNKQVQSFFAQGGHGANVTVPHKQQVMAICDQLTDRAQQAGAVNTLFKKNDQLWGDNTDGIGLLADLQQKQFNPDGKSILIIGAGGAVHGIIPALLDSHPAFIDIVNRTESKAEKLAETHQKLNHIKHSTWLNQSKQYDLIIHGTGCGHQGLSPPLPTHLSSHTVAYDLSYGQVAKPFINRCHQKGLTQVFDGLGMLQHQAAASFSIWFNRQPEVHMKR